jgi:hypothetical protein
MASLTLVRVYGQENSQIIVPNYDDKYSAYVQMLENGETKIDYQDFRFSFLESEQFVIASKKTKELSDLTKRMYAEMEKSNYGEVISITQQMLSIDYTNMLAHKILRQTYEILKDTENAQKYKAIQFGLLHSIIDTGDGKTCETAWKVIQISEEYFILNILGAEVKQQSIYKKGGFCDKMDVIIEKEEKTYYFEISKVFEGYNKKE